MRLAGAALQRAPGRHHDVLAASPRVPGGVVREPHRLHADANLLLQVEVHLLFGVALVLPHPELLFVVEIGGILEEVRGDKHVVEKAEAYAQSLLVAALQRRLQNLPDERPEHDDAEHDLEVRAAFARVHRPALDADDVVQRDDQP